MKIWYVVDAVEYWLEPEYTVGKTGRIQVSGAGLYDRSMRYKGWWAWRDWPSAVRKTVKEAIDAYERRRSKLEREQRVRVRSHLGKTKD
jgi:hypothetical protein